MEQSGDAVGSGEALEFPSWALQPRTETGAKQFLTKYPEYDGRGIIIAILDSGVDPGAGGMQVTSDGKPKILERIDCSGAGDVDMSKEVTRDAEGFLEGVSGRKLKVPDEWDSLNAGATYRVGVKRIFDLYPRSLRDRIIKERQEKVWDPEHRACVAKTAAKLDEANAKTSSKSSGSTTVSSSSPSSNSSPPTGIDKLAKDSLENEMEMLNNLDKKFKDNGYQGDRGPLYDVVSFHDGNHWNVVIDTSEAGDLEAGGVRLRPFGETRDFAVLTKADLLNVSVNVFDEGKLVQLVTVCSSHGTHVASMAAANFPDQPEKNGIAPGAQIISLTIGDARLSGMETGTALSRAMIYVMQRNRDSSKQRIDAINMSYGEYSHFSSSGRVGSLMREVINDTGVVWMASAGNDGPALCTVGTPPDIATNTVIGVGAYVSPEMMVALYSTREKLQATPYTWTSRGPTIDGDRGVTVCAPGGAITSVPPYNLRCTQLMNGTSMASPHVAGSVAVILSGLKARSLKWSPFSVKRALANTAKPLTHMCHYGQGNGLLQIEAAFTHLVKYNESADRDVTFAVACFSSGAKGVHLRDHDVTKAVEVPIKVTPAFLDKDQVEGDKKVAFNMKFALTCDAGWVKHPQYLDLMYTPRHFSINVDPTSLSGNAAGGGVFSAYVRAFDVSQPDKGTVFEIPVTVVVPEALNMTLERPVFQSPTNAPVTFQPNQIKRHFVRVPDKATWAVIKVKSHEPKAVGKFVMHTVQIIPKTIVKAYENYRMFTLNENAEFKAGIKVKGGVVLELCLAKWWANIGHIDTSYSVTFHGIQSDCQSELVLHGAESYKRVNLTGALAIEEVQPDISLKTLVQNYRPTEGKVVPLGERDVIPPAKRTVYELQLTYSFSISGKNSTEITPDLPLLSDVLYESEFESQLWLLYNAQKQFIASGDAYPSRWTVKVGKDDYVLRAHVRHEKKEVLDKMLDLPLSLHIKLAQPVSVDYYTSFAQASVAGKKGNSLVLHPNKTAPIFVTTPSCNDKHLKGATVGQYLLGSMTVAKDEFGKKVDSIPVKYVFSEGAKREKNKSNGNGGAKKDATFQESMFEHKTSWLAKMDPTSEESAAMYQELMTSSEQQEFKLLQVHAARLTSLDFDSNKDMSLEKVTTKRAEEAIQVADKILAVVKANDILAFFAVKNSDLRPAEVTEATKKEMEKKKGWYLEASAKKGLALCVLERVGEAGECLLDCLQFVDQTDAKVVFLASVHAERAGQLGRAVKLLQHQLDEKPSGAQAADLDARLVYLYEKLGWEHAAKMSKLTQPIRFPKDYDLF